MFKPMTQEMVDKTEKAVQDFCGADYHEKMVKDVTKYLKTQEEIKRRRKRS